MNPFAGSPLLPTMLQSDLPLYPHLMQALRITEGTVPGPSGYASSSALGQSLYVAFVQQLDPTTLLPRDREPCLALDLNRTGLAPGYYTNCRLAGSHQSLPIFEVTGSPVGVSILGMTSPPLPAGAGITPAQISQLQTLSTAQQAVLANLTPCQLLTLVNSLPISQIHTLTSGVLTPTQLYNFISNLSTTELTNLYSTLNTSQIITISNTLNNQEISYLTTVLTATQIRTLIQNLTTTQLQKLVTLPPHLILYAVSTMTTPQLQTYLNLTQIPLVTTGKTTINNTDYTILTTDVLVEYTALSTSRILTLPAANSFPPGYRITIQDGSGSASGTVKIQVTRSGSDTVNGSSGTVDAVTTAYGGTVAISDGVSKWTIQQFPSTGGGGGGVTAGTEGTLTATGSAQGDAAPIVTDSVVVSGADGVKGIILPNTAAAKITIINDDPIQALKLYPNTGASIFTVGGVDLGTNQAFDVGTAAFLVRASSTIWRIIYSN